VTSRVIVSLVEDRRIRRQIARATQAIGAEVHFVSTASELWRRIDTHGAPHLLICDGDGDGGQEQWKALLPALSGLTISTPIILLSTKWDNAPLFDLINRYNVGSLIAKHVALGVAYPMVDERELLVTCEKILRRDIFGIDKYIGAFGVALHHATIGSLAAKASFLDRFQQYVTALDCPLASVPEIVTVADELIVNAAVHAPHLPDGTPKYEALGVKTDIVLEPHELIEIAYGCDGRYLMLSVADNFGRLGKRTLYDYLSRSFQQKQLTVEYKPSGAGLGLSFAARSSHQLVFNIQDATRTEAIAGWYLRVMNAREFAQFEKSLNVFWLPTEG
jgi:hypothetical protein